MRCIAVHVPFFPHSLGSFSSVFGRQLDSISNRSLSIITHDLSHIWICVCLCAFVWLLTKFKLYFILIWNSIYAAFMNYSSLMQQNLAIMHVIANAFNLSIHSFIHSKNAYRKINEIEWLYVHMCMFAVQCNMHLRNKMLLPCVKWFPYSMFFWMDKYPQKWHK